jgi:hypothetical protein
MYPQRPGLCIQNYKHIGNKILRCDSFQTEEIGTVIWTELYQLSQYSD